MVKRRTLEEDSVILKKKFTEKRSQSDNAEGDPAIRSLRKRLKRAQRKLRNIEAKKRDMESKKTKSGG